jgi:hypothetical protein
MMVYIGVHIENNIQLREVDWPTFVPGSHPVPGTRPDYGRAFRSLMQKSYLAIKFSGDEVEVLKDYYSPVDPSVTADSLTDKHKTMLMIGLIPKHLKKYICVPQITGHT